MIFIYNLTCNFDCVESMLVTSVNMPGPVRRLLDHLQLIRVYLGCNLAKMGYSLYLMDYRLATLVSRLDLLQMFLALPVTYTMVTMDLKMLT